MRHPALVRKTVLSSLLSLATLVLSLFLAVLALQGIMGCGSSSPSMAVTIATPSASSVDPGDSVTLMASASNSSMGVTWTLSGTGCSGSACGTLSGSTMTTVVYTAPASLISSFMATITATSASDTTKSATVNLTVVVAPNISTAAGALMGGTVGSAYSVTLAGAGGITPYTWSLVTGSLPAGMSLGAGTGIISGTPTAAGSPSFTVKLTDSGSPALTSSTMYAIAIATPPAIVFGAPMLPNGTVGTAYSGSISATGGAGVLTYALASGALPASLQLNTATGAITGTPTAAAASTFTVKATDAYGDTATSASYSITIANPALKITTSMLPVGTAGTAYSQTLAASGGAGGYTWSVTSGQSSLSAVGLSVSTAGVVSASSPTQGTATFTVKVTDSANNTATANFTVTINGVLSITTANTLPSGTVNTAYSQTFAASGGSSPYTWSVTSGQSSLTSLGLSLSTGGVLSGSSPAFGTASFGVKVTDSANNTATGTFSVTINNAALSISTTNIPGAVIDVAYSEQFSATGGSGKYSWSITNNPGGLAGETLTLTTGGLLSGTPTTVENVPFTITVTDTTTNDTVNASFTLVVSSATAALCTHDGSGNSLLNGNYAFLLGGFDPNGNHFAQIGDFVANGAGDISGGNSDTNSSGYATQGEQQFTFSGTYSIGCTDDRGMMTLTNGNNSATSLPATSEYCFVADTVTAVNGGNVAESGRIIEADGSGFVLSGFFQIQNQSNFTNASLVSGYQP